MKNTTLTFICAVVIASIATPAYADSRMDYTATQNKNYKRDAHGNWICPKTWKTGSLTPSQKGRRTRKRWISIA